MKFSVVQKANLYPACLLIKLVITWGEANTVISAGELVSHKTFHYQFGLLFDIFD